ncbi:MAG: DNA repair protein RadC [Chloroflexota bacterium]|nr:DNA repair protein RadC [Chloroflexota bacterium]
MESNPYQARIKEMPEEERPRERLELYGASALSNAELLAILLRTGSRGESAVGLATRLLTTLQGLDRVANASLRELCELSGIGPAKACQIIAAIALGRRAALASEESRPQIGSPHDAANVFMARMTNKPKEEMHVMLLDTKHKMLRTVTVYVGSLNTAMVRVGEVFRDAVKDNAAAIIVAHNHPSGDPMPSAEDIQITKAIVDAGKLLDIEVLDHLIIGDGRYQSLKEKGLGFQ